MAKRRGGGRSRASQNADSREKYLFARDVIGLQRKSTNKVDANHVRNWSWDRIRQTFLGEPPKAGQAATDFLKRRAEKEDYDTNRKQTYGLLRGAGFDPNQAKRYRSKSKEFIQAAVTFERKVINLGKEPQESGIAPEGEAPSFGGQRTGWDYEPFDREYVWNFAYKVKYEYIDEETGEIKTRWVTVVNYMEMDYDSVIDTVVDMAGDNYAEHNISTVEIVPMMAGLPGGTV